MKLLELREVCDFPKVTELINEEQIYELESSTVPKFLATRHHYLTQGRSQNLKQGAPGWLSWLKGLPSVQVMIPESWDWAGLPAQESASPSLSAPTPKTRSRSNK